MKMRLEEIAAKLRTEKRQRRIAAIRHVQCYQRPTIVLTEGFDTADLKDAKALLEELSG